MTPSPRYSGERVGVRGGYPGHGWLAHHPAVRIRFTPRPILRTVSGWPPSATIADYVCGASPITNLIRNDRLSSLRTKVVNHSG